MIVFCCFVRLLDLEQRTHICFVCSPLASAPRPLSLTLLAAQPEHSAASWKSECRCCCCFLHLCNITTSGRNVVFGRKPNWTFTFCLNALFVHLACIVVFLLITNGKYRQMNGNSRACVCVCVYYVKYASSDSERARAFKGSTGAPAGQPCFTFSLSKSSYRRQTAKEGEKSERAARTRETQGGRQYQLECS